MQRPDGTQTAPGEIGEIVVGGEPGITLFAGYLDDPDTTAASFRDGWFLTGDRARRDEDGRFHFDGRRTDVLEGRGRERLDRRGREVLAEHPAVLEAAVVGSPTPSATRFRWLRRRGRPGASADGRRARRVVRGAAEQGQAARANHARRRAAAHERRQDPQVPAPRGGARMTVLTDDLLDVVRRVDHRRVHGRDDAAGDLHVRGVPRVRARGAVRPRVAVRRPGRVGSRRSATTSRRPSTASRSSSLGARTARSTRSPPSASTAGCRSPTAPATAPSSRARTTTGATTSTAACSAHRRWSARSASTRRSSRCRHCRSSCGRASCSSTSIATRRRWRRRWRATSRSSSTTSWTTPSAPARSR